MNTDAFLFVDGSSSKNEDIGGWTAITVKAGTGERKMLWGVTYPTTISRCELIPIIEGLRWIKANYHKTPTITFKVVVYSDSEYTVRTLSGEYPRRKNTELWAAVDEAASGMDVRYIWRERNTTQYGTLCDAMCGMLRQHMIDHLRAQGTDPRSIELPRYACPDPDAPPTIIDEDKDEIDT